MIKRSGHRTDLELLVNDAILLSRPVDAVIALAHPADGAADGVGGEASCHAAGGLVHRGEVDLDGSVVPGRQDPVGGAWDVHVNVLASFVLHSANWVLLLSCRSESSNKSLVMRPVDSSTEARLIWMEAWSLADKILLEALHFLGMYMSTYSPASFCMVQVGLCYSLVEVNQAIK